MRVQEISIPVTNWTNIIVGSTESRSMNATWKSRTEELRSELIGFVRNLTGLKKEKNGQISRR